MNDSYDLVIIGGGSAGLTAAGFAIQLEMRVALVEKRHLSSDCTWTGCVPSKTLLKAAKVAHQMRTADRHGLTSIELEVDLKSVMAHVQAVVADVYHEESPDALRADGIEVFLGAARFLDPHTFYSATGQRDYLSQAEELADYVLAELSDPERGGFYDLPADPNAIGALSFRDTPCQDNVVAARFFARLYWVTDQAAHHDAAEDALRLCAINMIAHPDYALTADDLLSYPLILAVVGTPGEETTDALLAAANRFYAPGKVVVPLDPALGPPTLGDFAYPSDRVAIYGCYERRCSLPVEDPADLAEQISWLMIDSEEG